MIIQLNFKTPDVMEELSCYDTDLSVDEMKAFLSKWLKYEECVTIEFDTVAKTAKVLKAC